MNSCTSEKQQSDSRRTELEEEKNILQQQQKELRQQLITKETKINELKDAIAMSSKLAEEKTQLESEKNGECETILNLILFTE